MWRTLRARVGILSLGRLPLRVHSEARQNVSSIERVRFKKPWARPRDILGTFIVAVPCCMILEYLIFSPLDKALEDVEVDEKELEEESLFIPFPLTTKLVQPPPYRGSDPEWQEYIKFSKDTALGKRIRDDLANFIKATVEKSTVVTIRCGKDVKLRRYWLDVDFPMAPPPEFERSGLEITDNDITWKSMPVDSLTVFRIRQALWPSALTQSLWSFSKVLIKHDTASVAGMVGLRTKQAQQQQSQHLQSLEQLVAEQRKQAAELNKTFSRNSHTSSASTTRNPDEHKQTDADGSVTKTSAKLPGALAKTMQGKGVQEMDSNANSLPLKMHLLQAYMAFKIKLHQKWKPAFQYPPRGAILVSGLVELDSPKAWIVVDVKAAWDPKTKEYDPRNMHLVIRRFQMKRQEPVLGH